MKDHPCLLRAHNLTGGGGQEGRSSSARLVIVKCHKTDKLWRLGGRRKECQQPKYELGWDIATVLRYANTAEGQV